MKFRVSHKCAAALAFVFACTSCDFMKNMSRNDSPEKAKELATTDLKCPNDQVSISLTPLRPARCVWHGYEIYEASGCSQTARYRCYSNRNGIELCENFPKEEQTVRKGEPCNSNL